MRTALITILVWMWPLPLLSDIILIDVQEEADVSRLVVPLPDAGTWTANVIGDQLRLDIEDATGFDPSMMSVDYQRLGNMRMGASPSTLLIDIACSCDIRSYQIGRSFLMVEMRDQQANVQPQETTALSPFLTSQWRRPDSPTDIVQDDQPNATAALETVDSTFALGLARGAYDGFLTLSGEIDAENQTTPQLPFGQELPIGITASLETLRNAEIALTPQLDCDFATTKILDHWDFSKSFSLEIGQARNHIAAALPMPDTAVWQDLALLLIGYGLGAEAQVILDTLDQDDDFSDLLHFMSQVLEGAEATEPNGIEACGETLVLWRFLNDPHSITSPEGERLMMAYKLLSPILQRRFMDEFSIALTETRNFNLQSELTSYRNTVAQLEKLDDDPELEPTTVALDDTRKLMRADLSRNDINSLAKTHMSLDQLSLGELETLWIEQRSQPNGPALLSQILDRHLAAGNYAAILDFLETAQRSMDQDAHAAFLDEYLLASITSMSDADVVAFTFRDSSLPIPDAVTEVVQKRLQDIGMASQFGGDPRTSQPGEDTIEPALTESFQFSLPISTSLPSPGIPTVAEAEEIMERSAEIRRKVQDFINVNEAR